MIKRGFSIGKLICYIVLIIWAVITIYRMIYTFLTSFKTQTSMYTNMFGLPETWHFENYAGLFADMGFGKSIFATSFFITITTVVCQLVISCMVSFVITQIRSKSSNKSSGTVCNRDADSCPGVNHTNLNHGKVHGRIQQPSVFDLRIHSYGNAIYDICNLRVYEKSAQRTDGGRPD